MLLYDWFFCPGDLEHYHAVIIDYSTYVFFLSFFLSLFFLFSFSFSFSFFICHDDCVAQNKTSDQLSLVWI